MLLCWACQYEKACLYESFITGYCIDFYSNNLDRLFLARLDFLNMPPLLKMVKLCVWGIATYMWRYRIKRRRYGGGIYQIIVWLSCLTTATAGMITCTPRSHSHNLGWWVQFHVWLIQDFKLFANDVV